MKGIPLESQQLQSTESQNEMANATANADGAAGGSTSPARGPSLRSSLLIAVAGAIFATGATVLVLRNEYSVGIEALFAAVALGAFGVTVYGLIQAVLAIIDTAGERRRQDREVTERRKGARARQPRKS
jgi:hypothetical protein